MCGGVIGSTLVYRGSIPFYDCWEHGAKGEGSNPFRTFQRTAISGNSFTYSQKLHEWHTSGFEYRTCNRVHVETALIFITPAALCATGERHLRRIMCVKQCDCNNCYKKKTCADYPYCFEDKDVDCNSQGIQGCKHKVDYPIVGEKI